MQSEKVTLSVSVDSGIRRRYLKYCETNKIWKGGLMERLITSFLDGETLTQEDIGKQKEPTEEQEPAPVVCHDS